MLQNVKTYLLTDPKSRRHVLQNLDKLVIKAVGESGGYGMLIGPRSTAAEREEFARKIEADPRNYIAQPTISFSRAPCLIGDDLEPRHVDLRPYILYGDKIINGEKMPAVQVVLTMLHAGGKFDASNYKVSGGLHGVGVSCVNALSQELDVEIWRDGFAWEQDYAKGIPTSKLRKMGVSKRKGTKVHFLPDRSIFTVTEYNYDTLAQRLRELAFLNKGLEITLTDERTTDTKTGESKRQEFKYVGGIAEFIKHLNRGKQVLHDKPCLLYTSRCV